MSGEKACPKLSTKPAENFAFFSQVKLVTFVLATTCLATVISQIAISHKVISHN
jgi:hypothetical protein